MPTFFLLLPFSPRGDCSMRRERRREREGEKGLFPPLVLPTQPQPTYLTSTSSPHFPTSRPTHRPTDRPTERRRTHRTLQRTSPLLSMQEGPPFFRRRWVGRDQLDWKLSRLGGYGLGRGGSKKEERKRRRCAQPTFSSVWYSPPPILPLFLPLSLLAFNPLPSLSPLSMYAIVRRTWYSRSYT